MVERAMTLRLPVEQHQELQVLARIGGRSVSEEVRLAVAAFCAKRKADPEFAAKARALADEWAAFADSCIGSRSGGDEG